MALSEVRGTHGQLRALFPRLLTAAVLTDTHRLPQEPGQGHGHSAGQGLFDFVTTTDDCPSFAGQCKPLLNDTEVDICLDWVLILCMLCYRQSTFLME